MRPGPGGDRGPHRLVEQHGRRVADRDLPRRRAEHDPAELVAHGQRQVEPALVPARGSAARPTRSVDERRQPRAGHRERAAQRVAVEVDERGRRRRRSGRGSAASGSAASRAAGRRERQARAMSTPRARAAPGDRPAPPSGWLTAPRAFPTGLVAPRLTGPALAGAGLGGPVIVSWGGKSHMSHIRTSRAGRLSALVALGHPRPRHGHHGRRLRQHRVRGRLRPSSPRPPTGQTMTSRIRGHDGERPQRQRQLHAHALLQEERARPGPRRHRRRRPQGRPATRSSR